MVLPAEAPCLALVARPAGVHREAHEPCDGRAALEVMHPRRGRPSALLRASGGAAVRTAVVSHIACPVRPRCNRVAFTYVGEAQLAVAHDLGLDSHHRTCRDWLDAFSRCHMNGVRVGMALVMNVALRPRPQ